MTWTKVYGAVKYKLLVALFFTVVFFVQVKFCTNADWQIED
jgi:hypothetical protein